MIATGRKKRLVLYHPVQAHPLSEEPAAKDLLPLALLQIATFPEREGYEIVLIDGNLFSIEEAHRRAVEACEGALLFATTGILCYQVADAFHCSRAVKARHPDLPMIIGGWFASSAPEIQLGTGLYDAVAIGQGEFTFRDIVAAVDAGEPLDGVRGLALLRDGEVVRTGHRALAGWNELPACPWHLLDIAPYREAQLRSRGGHEAGRLLPPPGYEGRPFFGISFYASFGCPEPCTFCCSPEMSGMRWKAMPAERMVDELTELKQRWGFDRVRFYDANWGVAEKRSRAFAEGLLARDESERFHWYCFIQAASILQYQPSTLDLMRDSGLHLVLIGGETGDEEMLQLIGKRSEVGGNLRATQAMDQRGVQSLVSYIVGYPGESERSMLNSIDEACEIASTTRLSRPMVWPFRPVPGTALWPKALELGYRPPDTLEEWGTMVEYHLVTHSWPGQVPERVVRARRLFEHFSTLSLGLARDRVGWWERRAQQRLARRDFRLGRVEAKAFDLWNRVGRRLAPARA